MQNAVIQTLRITDTALSQSKNIGLREGSVVIGKVLEKNGSNLIISLGGHRISVSSEVSGNKLLPGMTFRGQIFINQIDGKAKIEIALLKDFQAEKFISKESVLAGKLLSLGLEMDFENLELVSFLMESGEKLDGSAIKNALLKAFNSLKSKKSRKIVERAKLILAGKIKGLELGEESVSEILGESGSEDGFEGFENSGGNSKSKSSSHSGEESDVNGETLEIDAKKLEDFVKQNNLEEEIRISACSFAESIDEAAKNGKIDALSLFNTLAPKMEKSTDGSGIAKSSGSAFQWFCFPFKWDFQDYKGTIKILQRLDNNQTEKIVVSIENGSKSRNFTAYFENGKISEIKNDGEEKDFDRHFERLKGCSIKV